MSQPGRSAEPLLCGDCTKPLDMPLRCSSCGALNPQPVEQLSYFELFGLEPGFEVDERSLHRRYLSLSRATHPDMIGDQASEVRGQVLALSAELNRAYDTLRHPVSRAEYLLSLAGGPSPAQDKGVPGNLLAEVMMLREELEEAGDDTTRETIRRQVAGRHAASLTAIIDLCGRLASGGEEIKAALRKELNGIKYWDNLLAELPPSNDD